MAKQIINIGTGELTGDGESLRSAFDKVNDNFDELYLKDTSDFNGEFSSLTNKPTTLSGYGITDAATSAQGALAATAVQPQTSLSGYGITDAYTKAEVNSEISTATSSIVIPSGSTQSIDVVAADSTVLVDSVNGTLNATTLTGALPAIDGSALTGVTTAFSNITSTPTTLAGYGITDAATLNNMAPTGAVDFTGATSVDFTGATITGTSFLTSYTETDPVVGAITGLVKSDGAGNISAAVAGTDYLTTVAFADLTGKPTTLAGYGITDALTSGGNITLGGDLDVGGNSIVSSSNGSINIAPNGTGVIALSGKVRFAEGTEEKFATLTGSTGVVAHDCDNGHVFYHTGASGDITANFTNFGLTAEYGTNLTVIINQGATPYEVTAVQIGGAAQTINWQGGSAPTGNANGIDSFSFTILNDGGSYVVLGQMVDFT